MNILKKIKSYMSSRARNFLVNVYQQEINRQCIYLGGGGSTIEF